MDRVVQQSIGRRWWRSTGWVCGAGMALLLVACASGGDGGWRAELTAANAPAKSIGVGQCAGAPRNLPVATAPELIWSHPIPQGDNLLAVAGVQADNLWAVGDKGRIMRGNGRRWWSVDTGVRDYLSGVWVATNGEVFATGYNGRALHWDGKHWQDQPTGVSNDFNGVWGSAPDDVYTVGDRGVIFHFDGRCWKRQESPTDNLFFAVWGSGPKDVWAVGGRSNVAHYDGTRWQSVNVGVNAHFVGVWGTGPDDRYIVGNDGMVLHGQGDRWTREEVGTRQLLRWVWGSGPDDVWVAGDGGEIRRFDGSRWQRVSYDTDLAIRGAVEIATGGEIGHVLVGDDGLLLQGGKDGFIPVRRGTFAELLAVDGDWAVGEGGTVLNRLGDEQWRTETLNGAGLLTAVGVLGDGRVLVGGNTLWVADHRGWTRLAKPRQPIRAITAWQQTAVAVGEDGLVLRWAGESWEPMSSPTTKTLRAVAGSSDQRFWVVGDDGIAFVREKGQWHPRPLLAEVTLTGVTSGGTAVGMDGIIRRWRTDRWEALSDGGLALYGVATDPKGGTWAVGDFGTILTVLYDRNQKDYQITSLSGITGQSLWGVASGAGGRMTLVGSGGTILERPARWRGIKIK